MKDSNHERPEKDNSEEIPVFSDHNLEDDLKLEEEYSNEGEIPTERDHPPQILASLKRQRRLKRSLFFVVLLCFGLGILLLAVFFLMKPEVKKPQIVAKRMKRSTPAGEREESSTIPSATPKKGGEGEPWKGGMPAEEKPIVLEPSEPSTMIQERGVGKKVFILGEKELPKEEKEVKGVEKEGERSRIRGEEEGKPQVAMIEKPKGRAKPAGKLPTGRYTVNVGSFRERVRAERFIKALEAKGYKASVAEATIPKKGTWYRVSVGRFSSWEEAQAFARALKEKDGIDSFVRELKGRSLRE